MSDADEKAPEPLTVTPSATWSVALTADEIAALAAGVSPLRIRPEALIEYWPPVATE